jgi:hypothetical protein
VPLKKQYIVNSEKNVYTLYLFEPDQIPAAGTTINIKFQPINKKSGAKHLPLGPPLTVNLKNPYK